MTISSDDLYRDRPLCEGYPEVDRLAHEAFSNEVLARPDDRPRVERLLSYLGRLVPMGGPRDVMVLGCGPHPQPLRVLLDQGHRAFGVEPVASFVRSAGEFLGDANLVHQGAAESLPAPDESLDLVLFESVLEHVDSVPRSLAEIYRVLRPGGVLYLDTTNRHRLDWRGNNGEFNVPFFNWFPRLLQESYVFQHLHYRPALANYTRRPAVHWFSFADLCSRGRDAGFAQFYSLVDLMRVDDDTVRHSRLRRWLLPRIQRNAWIRALALTQIGYTIAMYKRP